MDTTDRVRVRAGTVEVTDRSMDVFQHAVAVAAAVAAVLLSWLA